MVGFLIDLNFDPSTVGPGDVVDIRVTRIQNYFGVLEILDGDVQITGSGERVYVHDGMTGDDLVYGDLPQELVEVWGKVLGPSTACGDFECFPLDYGAPNPLTLRVVPGTVSRNDCAHVIAPLDVYDGEPQLQIDHPDWLRTY
jgi:hypothetical protein